MAKGSSSKRARIEERTEQLAAPIAEQAGVRIYDVSYEKQAGEYSLCVYIDKDGGVNIGDCETVSRALSDELDREDFIEDAYTLVVSSPGLGRKLTKDRHLAQSIGLEVELRTFEPDENKEKDHAGILKAFDSETLTIGAEDGERVFSRKGVAQIRLALDF